MTATGAQTYHSAQVRTFEDNGADTVSAITMNYVEEAIAIKQAAESSDMPVAISFIVEIDGTLPTGQRAIFLPSRASASQQSLIEPLVAVDCWRERIG